ncbi:MAG: hypothetical protein IPK83_04325 [Planctomycetes bacterium]|nr:hypothetical protein [Planctomycetota bacterium]
MAFVFKPSIVAKLPNGRKTKRRGKYYWVSYTSPVDGESKRHALKLASGEGIADKGVAQEEMRKLMLRLQRKARA